MKFKNIHTGVILEPKSKVVEEQLVKDKRFKEYTEDSGNKPLSRMTKDELIQVAQESGIEIPDGANKSEIMELIQASGDE